MSDALGKLIQAAKKTKMSSKEQEEQRRSFAYGNTKIENDRITRETINKEADALRARNG